jgi:hypothetical protein
MNSIEVFRRNKRDVSMSLTVVRSEIFDKLCVFSLAAFAETSRATSEQLEGARKIIEYMKALPEEVQDVPEPLTTGLVYDLSPKMTSTPTRKRKSK